MPDLHLTLKTGDGATWKGQGLPEGFHRTLPSQAAVRTLARQPCYLHPPKALPTPPCSFSLSEHLVSSRAFRWFCVYALTFGGQLPCSPPHSAFARTFIASVPCGSFSSTTEAQEGFVAALVWVGHAVCPRGLQGNSSVGQVCCQGPLSTGWGQVPGQGEQEQGLPLDGSPLPRCRPGRFGPHLGAALGVSLLSSCRSLPCPAQGGGTSDGDLKCVR